MYESIIISYLKRHSPEKWHQLAMDWNWDYGLAAMYWIIRNPLCDKATALLIYWSNSPRWYSQFGSREQVPDYELNRYDFVREIEKRYNTGFYKTEEFYFDPSKNLDDYNDVVCEQSIPEIMTKPVRGKELPEPRYPLSLPQEVWDEIDESERIQRNIS